MNQSWRVERRFEIHWLLGDGSSSVGNNVETRISGIPRSDGLINWSKKLRFMVSFKKWFL